MDRELKTIITAIAIVVIIICARYMLFPNWGKTDELIPGVTDHKYMTMIESNSTIGKYILNDSFMDSVSGINIQSKSELYGTNESEAKRWFSRCQNSFLANGFEEDYIREYSTESRYTGVYKNETSKRIFHVFEGDKIEESIGYYILLVVYEGRI